jgi:hypothetical protein
MVARAGSAAPGTPAGVVFDRQFANVRIGDLEKVSFFGGLLQGSGEGANVVTAVNDTGVWGSLSGTLNLVAREGSQAPTLAAGVLFDDFHANIVQITANSFGQMAFKIGLTGTGVTSDNDTSLWAQRPDGVLALIAREGDLWQVALFSDCVRARNV